MLYETMLEYIARRKQGLTLEQAEALQSNSLAQRISDHARMLLRLSSRTDNLMQIIEVLQETLILLSDLWDQKMGIQDDWTGKKENYIQYHPFMQYLVMLMKVRVLNCDASYPQLERVIERMI